MMPHVRLGERLRRINRLALGSAVGIVAVIIVISSFTLGLFALVETNRTQAKVLAENAAAALMFQDTKSAQEILQSLRNSPDIRVAALYGKDGRLFAAYQYQGHKVPATLDGAAPDLAIGIEYITLSQPVQFQQVIPDHLMFTVGAGGHGVNSNISAKHLATVRPLRLEFAGALHHVTSRGDRRENILLDDDDRYDWLDVLSSTCMLQLGGACVLPDERPLPRGHSNISAGIGGGVFLNPQED